MLTALPLRALLYCVANPDARTARAYQQLRLGALPNDDWRRLFVLVSAAARHGGPLAASAAVRAWPWGYHHFWAAQELGVDITDRAAARVEQLVRFINRAGAQAVPAPRREDAA